MKNQELAKILYQIGEILEMQEVEFKPRAYQKAAQTIENLSEDIERIYKEKGLKGLKELPGVGESIAEKIGEFLETGRIKYYEELRREVPVNLEELGKVPGLGPKKIKLLYQKLKIKNLVELEKAIKEHKLRELEGLGEITEENLQKGIELVRKGVGRVLLGRAYPLAEEIKKYLSRVEGVKRVEIAGSFRRGKETVGDLDVLAISSQAKKVMEAFVSMPGVKEIVAKGTTKSVVRLENGLEVDLRVLTEREFGSALMYFTGNKQHNIELRKIALGKGYTLSEYGLFKLKGKKFAAGRSEEEIYQRLGMGYIEPELRENMGELKASQQGKLPKLITPKEVIGDFQMHSEWSDGENTIEEMAEAAAKRGLKVMAITDHIGNIGVTNSLKGRRFERYLKEIEKVNKKKEGKIMVLKGAEIDINKEGKLLATKEMLKKLDIVLGAVHMGYKGNEEEQTQRLCRAMENYQINILAHPTARKINEREALALNMEKIYETARKTGTFLEIDGMPERMDLKDAYVKAAKEKGCKFSLGSDAHTALGLGYLKLAVVNARRGWLERKDILNCWNVEKIRKALRK